MQMSCPVSPPLPTVSCSPSGMMISLGVRPDDVKVKGESPDYLILEVI